MDTLLEIPYNTLIVVLGTSLVGATCGIVGTFAVLRKRALVGDAVAHAALPGVCLGYVLAGGQHLILQFCGAFATGLLAVATIRALPQISRTRTETAVAGVLSVFFGAGVVLSRMIQNQGTFGGRAGFDAFLFGSPGSLLFADLLLISITCLLVTISILATFRLSVGVTFDAEFLTIQGLGTRWIDWMHLMLLTITIVISLPAIGVVMIVALLITPAVTARQISDRFIIILIVAALLGMFSAATGAVLSSLNPSVPAGAAAVLVSATMYAITLCVKQFVRMMRESTTRSDRRARRERLPG